MLFARLIPVISLLFISCFVSCKNHQEIDAKTKQLDQVNDSSVLLSDRLSTNQVTLQTLTSNSESQYASLRICNDSLNIISRHYPMAYPYVITNDKELTDILEDYMNTRTEEEAKALLLMHAVLVFYGSIDSNRDTINLVSSLVHHLKDRRKDCFAAIQQLSGQTSELLNNLKRDSAILENLEIRRNNINNDLKVLNEEGII